MLTFCFRQFLHRPALKRHSIKVSVVKPGLGMRGEIHKAGLLVHRLHAQDRELTFCKPTDQLSLEIIQIQMIPPVAL